MGSFYVTGLKQNFDKGRIYVAGERHGLVSVSVTRKRDATAGKPDKNTPKGK